MTELTLFVVKSKQKCADMHTKALKPFDKIKVSLHRMILSGKIVKAGGLVYEKTTKETKKTIAGIRAFIWHDPWIDAGGVTIAYADETDAAEQPDDEQGPLWRYEEKMERIILVIPAASFQKGRIGKALSGIRKHLRIESATMYMQTQSRGC